MQGAPTDGARVAVGAACAVFDARGAVLLVRHSYGRQNWELPGGAGETAEAPHDTARRELLEETGLDLSIDRLTGVYFELEHEAGAMLHFVFRCHWDPALVPIQSSPEIAELGFWPPDDLPPPISDFTERRVRDAASGVAAAVATIPPRRWRG